MSLPKRTGFTLIELLVTITILIILAATAVSTYTVVQRRARDGRRQADIDNLAKAVVAAKNIKTKDFIYLHSMAEKDFPDGIPEDPNFTAGSTDLPRYCISMRKKDSPPPVIPDWPSDKICPDPYGGSITETSETEQGWRPFTEVLQCQYYGWDLSIYNSADPLCTDPTYAGDHIQSWMICARLENTDKPYCKTALQQ